MADVPSNLTAAIYAKTAQGQQEIQSRSLGLTPLARRILVLVDGKRSGQDLSTFGPGGEISAQLTDLLSRPLGDAEVAEALSLLRANPAMDQARTVARQWADDARECLTTLPGGAPRDALAAVCDYVVDRTG